MTKAQAIAIGQDALIWLAGKRRGAQPASSPRAASRRTTCAAAPPTPSSSPSSSTSCSDPTRWCSPSPPTPAAAPRIRPAPARSCRARAAELDLTPGRAHLRRDHDRMPAAAAGRFTFPGSSITVNRMGYGAMQLAGPHVFGPPADRDEPSPSCARRWRSASTTSTPATTTARTSPTRSSARRCTPIPRT